MHAAWIAFLRMRTSASTRHLLERSIETEQVKCEMSSELPCYTLINGSVDSDAVPNEQQLKHDFGKLRWVLLAKECV